MPSEPVRKILGYYWIFLLYLQAYQSGMEPGHTQAHQDGVGEDIQGQQDVFQRRHSKELSEVAEYNLDGNQNAHRYYPQPPMFAEEPSCRPMEHSQGCTQCGDHQVELSGQSN